MAAYALHPAAQLPASAFAVNGGLLYPQQRRHGGLSGHVAPGESARGPGLDARQAARQDRDPRRLRHVRLAEHHRLPGAERQLLLESADQSGRIQPGDHHDRDQQQLPVSRTRDIEQSVPHRPDYAGRLLGGTQDLPGTGIDVPRSADEGPLFAALEFRHPAHALAEYPARDALYRQPCRTHSPAIHAAQRNPAAVPEHPAGPRHGADLGARRIHRESIQRPGHHRDSGGRDHQRRADSGAVSGISAGLHQRRILRKRRHPGRKQSRGKLVLRESQRAYSETAVERASR